MRRPRSEWIAALASVVLLRAAPAAADGGVCPGGTTEVGREEIGSKLHLWCVDDEYVAEYHTNATRLRAIDDRREAIGTRLVALDETLANERATLAKMTTDLGGIERDCDAWVDMAKDARKKQNEVAMGILANVLLTRVDQIAKEKELASKAELDAIYDEYLKSPLMTLAQRNAREAGSVAPLRQWKSTKDFLTAMKRLTSIASAADAETSGEDFRAIAKLSAMLLKDPKAKLLAGESEFAIAAVYANRTAWAAKARIDQLLDLSEKGLEGVASFSEVYRTHVDEKKSLVAEKADLDAERVKLSSRQEALGGK